MEAERKDFNTLEEEIAYQQKEAEASGDEEKLEAAKEVRAAVQGVGLSVFSIRFKSDLGAGAEGSGKVMGTYESASDQISTVGTTDFAEAAAVAGVKVREYATSILKHEAVHRESFQADGKQQVDAFLTERFGKEAIHVTEEAAASLKSGSDRFDVYDRERAEAGRYAQELGMTRAEFIQIRLQGDAKKLEGQ